MPGQPATNVLKLTRKWRMARSLPGTAATPGEVDWSGCYEDAVVPGTVAASLLAAHEGDSSQTDTIDDFDWWYQCEFPAGDGEHRSIALNIGGLATIAEVWLNGESVHASRNMFRSFRIDVTDRIRDTNTLSVVFRSVNQDLKQRRPRGRWKTNLVSAQQLRWIRTSLLGRIPGWTPGISPSGPWHALSLEYGQRFAVRSANVHATVAGHTGTVHVRVSLEGVDPEDVVGDAALSIFGERYPLALDKQGDKVSITGRIDIDDVPLWHPHTHGAPLLHEYSVDVEAGGEKWNVRSGKLGFRTVEVDRSDGKLAFTVNGTNFFARGACWTTNDIVALVGDAERLEHTLNLVRDSGANMIRVGGTMTYETDRFYELCDELGISVWQDFMFANMDYPSGDEAFLTDASSEIEEQLVRLREHPCVIVWCGGSEVEQQAAMFGMTEDVWRSELFYDVIPGAIDDLSPGTPYFPSSPCEGALPFHNSSGPAHYFGVGAYRQTLDDLHKSNVKFASECLAFSNVPSDRALKKHFGSTAPPPHHPDWKSGVPRDSAAGWDFEDIRDHYIEALYDVDPVKLRYADRDRYIGISQVVTGELMEHVYGYWRSDRSSCGGGLIWFLNDIVPGAGWGYIDSDAQAKPLFYFLRRCWDNITLSFVDRGLDGLDVQVINETGEDLVGTLDVFLLQHSRIVIAEGSRSVDVDARGERAVSIDALLGRFFDTTYRYRFGPSKHDVVIASLTLDGDTNPRVACYFPNGHGIRRLERADISIRCEAAGESTKITLCADSYLQHVRLFAQNHDFDDNYFHLPPNTEYTIVATPISESNRPFRGVLSALNLASPVSFR